VTNDGRLFHARAAATGKARSPIVLQRVTGTTTAVDELERRLRLVVTSVARLMLSASLLKFSLLNCATIIWIKMYITIRIKIRAAQFKADGCTLYLYWAEVNEACTSLRRRLVRRVVNDSYTRLLRYLTTIRSFLPNDGVSCIFTFACLFVCLFIYLSARLLKYFAIKLW